VHESGICETSGTNHVNELGLQLETETSADMTLMPVHCIG